MQYLRSLLVCAEHACAGCAATSTSCLRFARSLFTGRRLTGLFSVLLWLGAGQHSQGALIEDFEFGLPHKVVYSPLTNHGWAVVEGDKRALVADEPEDGINPGWAALNRDVSNIGVAIRPASPTDPNRAGYFLEVDMIHAPGGFFPRTEVGWVSGVFDPGHVDFKGPLFGMTKGLPDNLSHWFIRGANGAETVATNGAGGIPWTTVRLVMDVNAKDGDGAGFLFFKDLESGDPTYYPVPDLQNIPLGFNTAPQGRPAFWNLLYFFMGTVSWLDNFRDGRIPIARLAALEVTQSIQDWNNSIPLIEGKPTVVRAYLEATEQSEEGFALSGRLRGFRNGVELPGSPLSPTTESPFENPIQLKASAAIARGNSDENAAASLNFILPPAWLNGSIKLQFETDEAVLVPNEPAEPNGGAADGIVKCQFQHVAVPGLIVRPIQVIHPSGSVSRGPSHSEMAAIMERVRGMYPVSRFDIRWGPAIKVRGSSAGITADQATLAMYHAFQRTPNRGNRVVIGLLDENDRVPSEVVTGSRVHNADAGWALTDFSSTCGHEISHLLGLQHAIKASFGHVMEDGVDYLVGACNERTEPPAGDFENWFQVRDFQGANGSLVLRPTLGPMDRGTNEFIYGLQRLQGLYLQISPSNTFELMGYCGVDKWPSDQTYKRLISGINGRWGGAFAPQQLHSAGGAGALAANPGSLLISGNIVSRSSVEWLPFQCVEDNVSEAPPAGDYTIQMFADDGSLLSQVSFDAGLPDDVDPNAAVRRAPFVVSAPFDASARRVDLRYRGALIGTRNASAHPPVVQLISPTGGEIINNPEFEVRWQGSDQDGDELSYTVEYSADDGASWNALVIDSPFTSILVRAEDIAGTAQARFRVLASDGFHCASAVTGNGIVIPDRGPDISISTPANGRKFYGQEPVSFAAVAVDMEEGQLSGNALEWRSDRDGLLGTGEEVSRSAWELSEGPHTITLTARDSLGHATVVSNAIEVTRFLPSRLRILPTPTNGVVALEMVGNNPNLAMVEVSSNLVTWSPWRTVTQTNLKQTILENVNFEPGRFFRVRSESVPTTVISQPSSTGALLGNPVQIKMNITGQWLTFQWFFNGSPLIGATNSTLRLDDPQPAQSGNYFLVVSNLTGVITSSTAVVTVLSSMLEPLHDFGTNSLDGINGWGPLTQASDGWIYGCARNGAIASGGVAFKMRPDGASYTVLRRFQSATDGAVPLGGLIEGSDGRFYGTTSVGGTNAAGTIFGMNSDGSQFSVLRHFRSTNDCRNPQAELVEGSDGALYGTAYNGGGFGRGGVFKINKDGSAYAILTGFNFGGSEMPSQPPGGVIEGRDGRLYGATEFGGSSNKGAIFALNKDGSGATVLKSLGLVAGGAANPAASLFQASDGLLYGTTYAGGASNLGTIFKISTNASFFSVIAGFGTNSSSGLEPRAGLSEAPNGQLIGTTRIGGGANQGAVFSIDRDGSDYQTLFSFTLFGNPGARSRSPMLLTAGGVFYSMTFGGGTSDQGIIFRYFLPDLLR